MSNSAAQSRPPKKRSYRLGRRAERQEETRRRIVDAAVELHCTVGPARTSVAQIAARAGVQRHTFYAHFPDERSLFDACSGRTMERDPLPDPDSWAGRSPGAERIRHGLEDLYRWYQRNQGMAGCVLRDAEVHAATRETVELRMGPTFARAREVLGAELGDDQRALLAVALDFACWRVLSGAHEPAAAACLMSNAIGAGTPPPVQRSR